MRDQEIVGLWEAYQQVHSQVEEVEQLDEASYSAKAARAGKDIGNPGKEFAKIAKEAGERYGSEERGKKVAGAVLAKLRAEETDLFDYILEHLVAEGYADTNEAALVIMANMSEDWRQSIVEEVLDEAEGSYGQTPKARAAMGRVAIARRERPASEYPQKGEKTRKVKEIEKHTRRIDNGPDAGDRSKKSTKPRHSGFAGKSGRGKLDQDSRDYARDSAVEYTSGGHKPGSGTVTKNPKKLRKQKAMGEHD